MNGFKLGIGAFIMLLISTVSLAQTGGKFTREKNAFFKEISAKISIGSSEKAKLFESEFKDFWKTADAGVQELAYEGADLLLSKKCSGYPHIFHYLLSLKTVGSGASATMSSSFQSSILDLIKSGSKKKIEPTLETIYLLSKEGVLYSDNKSTWFVQGGNLKIEEESKGKWVVDLTEVTVSGIGNGDTLVIQKATGKYSSKEKLLLGTGGQVTWKRVGLDPTKNFAKLGNYELKAGIATLRADTVVFTSDFYSEPLEGEFADKLVKEADLSTASYPRFSSFQKNLVLQDLLEGVNYRGGISVQGRKLLANGSVTHPAALEFMRNGEPFLITKGLRFAITPNLISGEEVSVLIRLKGDSIYHPSLRFQYLVETGEINLLQVNEQASQTPFFNSYHMVDMYAERLWMQNGGDTLYFGAVEGTSVPRASFESSSFFSEKRFQSLQLVGQESPLEVLADMADGSGWEFSLKQVQTAFGGTEGDVVRLVYSMAQKGFIYYNQQTKIIQVKQKLFDYLQAHGKKIDYDVLRFVSRSTNSRKPNAALSLDSLGLDVYGLSKVTVSDSQAVELFPKGRKITLERNRNFRFDGKIKAGNFTFYGADFDFNYDNFKIEMPVIDSCKMVVLNRDIEKNGKRKYIPITRQLEDLKGDLLVDEPTNKSGLWTEDHPDFPVFTSTKESFVYYDDTKIQDGVYNREEFYFELTPFEIDSLDNFDPATMEMAGTLKSAGIFPDIQSKLSIQEDFSLGFEHKTPTDGLPMYGGMAKFQNEIHLSDDGLQGDGDLLYLTSTSTSPQFTFFPDSTKGRGTFANLGEGPANVPDVNSKRTNIFYVPAQNNLASTSLGAPFYMYGEEAEYRGKLDLSPTGLAGDGKLAMYDGQIASEAFVFEYQKSVADSSSFELNNVTGDGLAIRNDNVSSTMDFSSKQGYFSSKDRADSKIEFPSTQYIAYMDTYTWQVLNKKIEFSSSKGLSETDSTATKNSRFFSVHPNQDSLNFGVASAEYDINNYDILAKGVKKINIADSKVIPAGGKVLVHVGANMEPLENAEIIADRVNEFHRIFEATVNVSGAEGFKAEGKYNYVDEFGTKTPIPFQNIRVEDGTTVADGTITADDKFQLSGAFAYRGGVSMIAYLKGLKFKGAASLTKANADVSNAWVAFEGQVDPKNVQIPITKDMQSDENEPLVAGVVIGKEDMTPYAAFIRTKKSAEDLVLFQPTGLLSYDAKTNEYHIKTKDTPDNPAAYGDEVIYIIGTGDLVQKGVNRFGMDFGQVDARGFGEGKFDAKSLKFNFKGVVKLDFYYPTVAAKFMSNQLLTYPFLQPFNVLNTEYQPALGRWTDKKTADKMYEQIAEKGVMDKVPEAFEQSIVFAEVKLDWESGAERFISSGKLGLAHFQRELSSVFLNGNLVFQAMNSGDELNLYLEPDPRDWYFFKYKAGRMATVGMKDEFNVLFTEMKPNDLELKTKKDETPYQVVLTSNAKRKQFLESLMEE